MLVGQTLQILQEFEFLYEEVVQLWKGKELEMPWETELCNFLLPVIPGSSQKANL